MGHFRADSCHGPSARGLLYSFMLLRPGLWRESHGEPSRLHTPCRDSLSAAPAPFLIGVAGSVRVNACPSVRSLCSRKAICPKNLATERSEASRVPTGHLASEAATSRSDSVRAPVLRVPARQPECVAGFVCVPFCVIPLRRSRRFVARNRPVPAAAAFAIELPAHSRGISRIRGRFRADYCDGPRTRILLHPIVQIKRGLWRDLHPDLPGRTLPIATPPASSTAHPSRLAVEGWRSRI